MPGFPPDGCPGLDVCDLGEKRSGLFARRKACPPATASVRCVRSARTRRTLRNHHRPTVVKKRYPTNQCQDFRPKSCAAPAQRPVKYVLFYESADDVAAKAPAQFPAHKARLDEFHARGDLLLVGTFADPQRDGSMSVWRTREAAEEFAREDPFVLNGVVRSWRVLDWNEILAP